MNNNNERNIENFLDSIRKEDREKIIDISNDFNIDLNILSSLIFDIVSGFRFKNDESENKDRRNYDILNDNKIIDRLKNKDFFLNNLLSKVENYRYELKNHIKNDVKIRLNIPTRVNKVQPERNKKLNNLNIYDLLLNKVNNYKNSKKIHDKKAINFDFLNNFILNEDTKGISIYDLLLDNVNSYRRSSKNYRELKSYVRFNKKLNIDDIAHNSNIYDLLLSKVNNYRNSKKVHVKEVLNFNFLDESFNRVKEDINVNIYNLILDDITLYRSRYKEHKKLNFEFKLNMSKHNKKVKDEYLINLNNNINDYRRSSKIHKKEEFKFKLLLKK